MLRLPTPNLPRPYILPVRSILQPASTPTLSNVRARFRTDDSHSGVKGHPFQEWKGSSTQHHAVNRARNNDVTDPEVEAAQQGREEHIQNQGIADATKSGATTQRDLRHSTKRAKEEHPHAPQPIIGMTDEKGEVSGFLSIGGKYEVC
ncbi:hypothetical protein BGW36DRAFT_294439 [Talaromyces proteolyticus]|uniref:Uncharacterized protein n=1 Tax=Talaromyces proteolyticus TaxID=1131652 RepID=A0AAD4PZ18_9EURO|nr:uncharacterized protein BGW36DRAFT_294439 [Talaromyces proteolyticus]KAH8698546.1 hypothetical protein BGW36DRAFT_294439 [Talaromyces proteolyticus]